MPTSHAPRHPAPGERTAVTCTRCGAATTVPFVPTPGRPVLCRECFGARGPPVNRPVSRPAAASGRHHETTLRASNQRQRMMAQGRKGHFLHDAKAILGRLEGGMEDQHVRAFLEGLFARGARQSTAAAQEFLDEKVKDETITSAQRDELGRLVERYSFWR